MFRGIMDFESRKIFIRRNIIILAVMFILLAFFCWNGIDDYELIIYNKKPFQEMEKEKVSRHIHYTAFGARGVRLFYIPDPISVIYNDSAVFPGMTAHVDTGEKLEVSNSFKGKDLFSDSCGFMDFAGIMLLISCFIALIYGWDGTRNPEYLKFISDISGCVKPGFLITLARIILLNLVFWIMNGLALVWMLINGINVANIYYLFFVLMITLVTTFFVVAGAVIGSFKSKVIQFITMPVVYFLLVLFIPWLILEGVYMEAKKGIQSIYEFEYDSFKYLMKFEDDFYKRFGVWESGKEPAPDDIKAMIENSKETVYQKMKNREDKRINCILKRIRAYQTISAIFPTSYYISANKELSSKGFQNFVNFYLYSYEIKFKFIEFYLYRKFWMKLPKSGVEPFIKGNEDIFYGKSHLPGSFLLGLIMAIGWIAGLLVKLYRIQKKVTESEIDEKQKQVKPVRVDFRKSTTLLALCKNDQIKGGIFRYYKSQKDAASITKIEVNFPSQLNGLNGIKVNEVVKHLCRFAGVKREKSIEFLKIAGFTESKLNSSNLSREDILKIYVVLKVSKKDIEYIILNDICKDEKREFENCLFKLLGFLEESGKKILYLSCDMFYPKDKDKIKEELNGEIDTFYVFQLPLESVTLR